MDVKDTIPFEKDILPILYMAEDQENSPSIIHLFACEPSLESWISVNKMSNWMLQRVVDAEEVAWC